jgi:hypothetical protein
MHEFDSKFKSKSGLRWQDRGEKAKSGKYTFIEKSYTAESEDDEPASESKVKRERSASPESQLDPAVQDLMGLIFNQQYVEHCEIISLFSRGIVATYPPKTSTIPCSYFLAIYRADWVLDTSRPQCPI